MNGRFFVIEGTDGSGKATQSKLLIERLVKEGYDVVTLDFPQYDSDSSYFVREYLAGNYGTLDEVSPYSATAFYALDRYSVKLEVQKALDKGKVVISNRYVGSNMAHQGSKFTKKEDRRGFFLWNDSFEFELLGLPRPTASVVLVVDEETTLNLIEERSKNDNRKKDIHEADPNHIKKSIETYLDLTSLFKKDFIRIDCSRNKKLMTREQVHNLVWFVVEKMLHDAPNPYGEGSVSKITSRQNGVESKEVKSSNGVKSGEKLVEKLDSGVTVMTEAGKEYLRAYITSTESNVYAFNDQISPVTIAAAMARLSRRGDDMRVTILDEFASEDARKDEKLLQRVITAYGDDSVQQLVGQHVVVEGASNLLTKKLEWGRLASYLEQSTRYIYFDQKDEAGNYKYVIPSGMSPKTKLKYIQTMDKIFDLYSTMVRKLTDYCREQSTVPQDERDVAWKGATRAQACDAVRPVLPVATKSTVGIFASGQALENMIMNLLADELPESRETGQKILDESRSVLKTFLERADKPERGGATVAYRSETKAGVKKLADEMLPTTHSHEETGATLTSYWPKNELDLVPNILYEHSDMSLQNITSAVEEWSYAEKEKVFTAYIGERLNRRHKPGRAFEVAHYSWDIICDYGIFRDLQRHRLVDDLNWQKLTPRYGYDTPQLIQDADLTDMFDECFELSLKLHGELMTEGLEDTAQYATLLGHKMRWKITYNARQAFHFHELRTTPHGHPGYRKLVKEMHEKVAEKHPLIGAAMKFVNQDEDPELTRLAAERYTQFKLNKLS